MTLRRQLVVVFALFAAALVTATVVPLAFASARAHLSSFEEDRVADVLRAAEVAGRNPDALADRFPPSGQDAAWLVEAPSREPTDRLAFPGSPSSAPEVATARTGIPAHRVGVSPLGRRLFVAVPVPDSDAVLWVSASLGPVSRLDSRTWAASGLIGAGALAAAALVGAALARRIARRLSDVAAGAKRFGEGRWTETIPTSGSDEIATLAMRLNEMASEIGRLLRREKDFVAAASHQLRTPLAAIKIRIDEIRALGAIEDRQALEDLDEMSEEVDRLTALTRRLLDLSATESRPEPRPVAAVPAAREAIGRVLPVAEFRGVRIQMQSAASGARLAAVPGAFEEVLFNVLDNAVKFSPDGAAVDVCVAISGHRVRVDVIDRGPGIEPDVRERVFAPFYRGPSTRPGHGLGLAICARLCAQASATLELAAGEEGGTLARIEWPSWPSESAHAGEAEVPLRM